MIYSVWNQSKKKYDYYETTEAQNRVNAPKPKHLSPKPFGVVAAKAAWPLPKSAKFTGSGDLARGRVASLGSFELGGNMTTVLILAGIAFVLWKSKALQ